MDTFLRVCFPKIHCTHFQDFGHFPKGVIWAKFRREFEKWDSQKVYPGTKIKRIYITWVCRRGLDGSRTLEVHYLARSDHGFNFLGYLENITTHLHFRDFGHSQKGCLSEKQNGKLKNDFLVTTFKNDIKKCLHTKVLRRGLDGSWLVGFWYLTRKDHGFNFWDIWKI